MKTLLCTLALAAMSAAASQAATLTVLFDQPNQTGAPGQTLQFFATITNGSAATVFLNSDDLNLGGLSFTPTDQFFTTVPLSLAAGGSSGRIELFDITISNPLLDAPGTFAGTYNLFGGVDGDAQDNLVSANFSVSTAPEPSTIYLLLGAGAVLAAMSRKARGRSLDEVR